MPEMPMQLAILKRLTAHLAGMTIADGYGYDMACKVFLGRTVFGSTDPLPRLSILEAPESAPGRAGGSEQTTRLVSWRLALQGFVADDKANPTDPAYWFKAQVERRLSEIVAEGPNGRPLYPTAFRLGRLIKGLAIENGVVRPPQENVSDKAFFWLPITIGYAPNTRSPMVEVADVDNP